MTSCSGSITKGLDINILLVRIPQNDFLVKNSCNYVRKLVYCNSHVAVAEWQTRMLEGHVGDRAGSSPVSHTKTF